MNINYKVKRTARKTIEIRILPDKTVLVTAPLDTSDEYIGDYVKKKSKWIIGHLSNMDVSAADKENKIHIGGSLLYRGKKYPLIGTKDNRIGFDGEKFYAPDYINEINLISNLIALYKSLALKYMPSRTLIMAEKLRLSPLAVKISSAKTRWGSCSGRDSINFSWRLIMADDDTIDYVIVHELTHISEKNHSRSFWEKVRAVMPDYEKYEERLKTLSIYLYSTEFNNY